MPRRFDREKTGIVAKLWPTIHYNTSSGVVGLVELKNDIRDTISKPLKAFHI
jgi:hypothetical protein